MKHKVETSKDLNIVDSSCTDDESEDGKSHVSHNDQDSDVSFESDNDEERLTLQRSKKRIGLNTLKRSTNEAMEKMENEKIRCWSMTQKKN